MYCPSCGSKREQTGEFCANCGKRAENRPPAPPYRAFLAVAAALAIAYGVFYFAIVYRGTRVRVAAHAPRPVPTSLHTDTVPETAESSYAKVRQALAMVVSSGSDGPSLGTAFCVSSTSKRSYFLTNHHVVGDASSVQLLLNGRHALVEGDVLAVGDAKRDLAVVVVPVGGVRALQLANDHATEGESVAVAGFPSIQFRLAESGLGLSPSMHVGTVNALVGDGFYIEYDAQTDHGNSGGPLYDVGSARVYGVVTYGIESESSLAVQNNLAIAITNASGLISQALQSSAPIASRSGEGASRNGRGARSSDSAAANSPADTVRQFYALLNTSQYQAAYALLSPDFQKQMPYDQWLSGYATTVRSAATVDDSDDSSDVHIHLVATDEKQGRLVTTVYDGQWSLVPDGRGGWLLDTGRLHQVEGN